MAIDETSNCKTEETTTIEAPVTVTEWPITPVDKYLRLEVYRLVSTLLDGNMLGDSEKSKLALDLYQDLQKSLTEKLGLKKPVVDDTAHVNTEAKRNVRVRTENRKYPDEITLFVYNCFGKRIPDVHQKSSFGSVVYAWAIMKSIEEGKITEGSGLSAHEINENVCGRVSDVIHVTPTLVRWALKYVETCCECEKKLKGDTYRYIFTGVRENWEDTLVDEVRKTFRTKTEKASSIEDVTCNMMLELE